MTEDIKDEAREAVQAYVLIGFDNEDEIFESILDMFYDEDDFDESWLSAVIKKFYNRHQTESISWKRPTDFDKLVMTFDSLIRNKIVCWQWAGSTRQDGEYQCRKLIAELTEKGIDTIGYCYYHLQDLERAIDPEIKNLYLGFDSATGKEEEALLVGNMICKTLTHNGLSYHWDGNIDKRISIENINWQKVPDKEDYGEKRVLELLLKS